MAGKRVHQLAKELGMPSKELLDVLQSMGEDIQNPLAVIGEDAEKAVVKKLEKAKTRLRGLKANLAELQNNPIDEEEADFLSELAKSSADDQQRATQAYEEMTEKRQGS